MFWALLMARLEVRRDFPVVIDGCGARVRQNESNGACLFFQQVRDEPRRPCQDGYPFQRAQRIAGVEEYRGNRTRYIESERLAEDIRQHLLNLLRNLDMHPRRSDFSRDREQGTGARIEILVLWMTIARDGPPRGAIVEN